MTKKEFRSLLEKFVEGMSNCSDDDCVEYWLATMIVNQRDVDFLKVAQLLLSVFRHNYHIEPAEVIEYDESGERVLTQETSQEKSFFDFCEDAINRIGEFRQTLKPTSEFQLSDEEMQEEFGNCMKGSPREEVTGYLYALEEVADPEVFTGFCKGLSEYFEEAFEKLETND
jgi:hypothetical protein